MMLLKLKKNYQKIKFFLNFCGRNNFFELLISFRQFLAYKAHFFASVKKIYDKKYKKNLCHQKKIVCMAKKIFFFFFYNKKNFIKEIFFIIEEKKKNLTKKKKVQLLKKRNDSSLRKGENLKKALLNTNSEIYRGKKSHSNLIHSLNFLIKINDFNYEFKKKLMKLSKFSLKNINHESNKFLHFFYKLCKTCFILSTIFFLSLFLKFYFENKYL
jgi:hypothetical protein